MIDLVVDKTNNKIQNSVSQIKKSAKYKENPGKYTYLNVKTDRLEMRASLGLMFARGLLGQNLHRLPLLFSEHSHFVFGATMSKNRMKFLYGHICFETLQGTVNKFPTDRFAAYRPFWEMFNSNLSKPIFPSEYMTIDETLYPMRHQIAFRQYNPKNPHKYGLLAKSLIDARFPYTYKAAPYAAKPTSGNGPYHLNTTLSYAKYLVTEADKDTSLKGRCISTYRLYTSIEQANWRLSKGITNLGSMDVKRIGIPDELKEGKHEEFLAHHITRNKRRTHV